MSRTCEPYAATGPSSKKAGETGQNEGGTMADEMPWITRYDAHAMIWSSWEDLQRLLIVGPLAYLALVLILRVSGKRMLSKMNAFDLVVTIALGSTLATTLLSKSVSLVEGVAALALLIGLQYLVAFTVARSPRMNSLAKSQPTLLYFEGRFLQDALRRENVTEDAVRAGIRQAGFARIEDVEGVVLEADGSLSAVSRTKREDASALRELRPQQTARQIER